jgi:hypothetical protein
MRKQLAILVAASMLISGCSMIYSSYFRNFSSNAVDLIGSNIDTTKNVKLPYENGIVDILDNNDAAYRFKDSLSIEKLDSLSIKIHIPARSTIKFISFRMMLNNANLLLTENHILIDTLIGYSSDKRINNFRFKSLPRLMPTGLYYYDYIPQ